MAKVPYTKLGLTKNENKEFLKFGDQTIEIKQYLPFQDKLQLIQNIVNNSLDDKGYINPCRRDFFEKLEIFYTYTNINFTDKQKEDEDKLYDLLESNGIINEIISHMEEAEYEDLLEKLNETKESEMSYITTAAAMIRNIIADLPAQADAAMKIVNNFDPKKFQAVKDFAVAANGGRPIAGV